MKMTDLPQLDPNKVHQKAVAQITELTSKNIQIETMLDALAEERETLIKERDDAIKERDLAKHELKNLIGMTESSVVQSEVVQDDPVT